MNHSTPILLLVLRLCLLVTSSSPTYEEELLSSTPHNHYKRLQDQTFVRSKIADDGSYEECIFSVDGFVGLQRTARHNDDFLRLLEITDGASTVELIFTSEIEIVGCDVTNSNHIIQRMAKHVRGKHDSSNLENVTISGFDILLNMSAWQTACAELHERELAEQFTASEPAAEPNREKRGITDLIWPGTKWCGRGNSAQTYYDLGLKHMTDKCCRNHDFCTDIILPLSYKYNYFNYGLLTVSSCECDHQFKECLRNAQYWEDDSIAEMIGHIYFNVIGMQCFDKRPMRVCKQTSWWGRCTQYKREISAVLSVSTY